MLLKSIRGSEVKHFVWHEDCQESYIHEAIEKNKAPQPVTVRDRTGKDMQHLTVTSLKLKR